MTATALAPRRVRYGSARRRLVRPERADLYSMQRWCPLAGRRKYSAICLVFSCGLPRRLSRAVTAAACCLVRRCPALATACRGPGWPSSACQSGPIVLPRQLTGRQAPGGWREEEAQQLSRPGASRAAAPGAEPRSGAYRRELRLAQAQIRGAEPSASPARARHASTAQRRTGRQRSSSTHVGSALARRSFLARVSAGSHEPSESCSKHLWRPLARVRGVWGIAGQAIPDVEV